MSILAKAPKLGAVDDRLIRSLLVPTAGAGGQILFVQEGVGLKGSATSDANSFLGTVFIASDAAGSIYVLWLPYSYVWEIDPMLVSPATKHSLALDTAAVAAEKKADADHLGSVTVMRAEWLFTQCIAFDHVTKIRGKTTMRGKRVVTLQRAAALNPDGASDFALTFFDGGVEKLVSVLGSFATVQPAPGGSPDDLVVTHPQHRPAPLAATGAAAAAASASPATPAGGGNADAKLAEFRDQMYSGDAPAAGSSSNNGGGKGASSTSKKVGQKVWGSVVSLVSRGGKFLAEHFLDDDEAAQGNEAGHVENRPRNSGAKPGAAGGDDSGDFDMMSPLQPIEEVKPMLRFPARLPPRGPRLSREQWEACFGAGGVLDADQFATAREIAFAGGIEDDVRGEVWKFLLGVYPLDSSAASRRAIDEENGALYDAVYHQWSSVGAEQEKRFAAFRERRTAVDKDVGRTDRNNAAFADDSSTKLVSLRRILLTYSFFNFDLGYCQGMSDLLALLLILYPRASDAEVFSVFRKLMEKVEGNFQNGALHTMAKQLRAIEVLVHGLVPPLWAHLNAAGATNMCFCFRMLLVLFKREFSVEATMKLWDVILACPFSDRYEIVLVVALLRAASEQIIDHAMAFDELIKYSNALCSALQNEEQLLAAGQELYEFARSQWEWTRKSGKQQNEHDDEGEDSGSGNNKNAKKKGVAAAAAANNPASPVDRTGSACGRPSVKELCDAFDIKP